MKKAARQFTSIMILLAGVFCLITNIAMAQHDTMSDVSQIEISKLYISPDDGGSQPASAIFDSVTYIPLETTKGGSLGYISEMKVSKDYFFIFDRDADALFIFYRGGKFLAKIDRDSFPALPGISTKREKLYLRSFWVNETLGELTICCGMDQRSLFIFGLDGVFLRAVPSKDVYSGFCQLPENGSYVSYVPAMSIKAETLIFADYDSRSTYRRILRAKTPRYGFGTGSPFYASGGKIFHAREFDLSIYAIDSAGIGKIYKMVFPLNYTPSEELLKGTIPNSGEYLAEHPEAIWALSNVYSAADNLSFKTVSGTLGNGQNTTFFYNIRTGYLTALSSITADSVSSYLPVFGVFTSDILACDGVHFYSCINSAELKNANAKGKEGKYSATLDWLLKSSDKSSNPVIISYRVKEKL